jgi:hypothetical protein
MVISPFFQSFTVQILVLPLTKLQLSETHPPTGAGLTVRWVTLPVRLSNIGNHSPLVRTAS